MKKFKSFTLMTLVAFFLILSTNTIFADNIEEQHGELIDSYINDGTIIRVYEDGFQQNVNLVKGKEWYSKVDPSTYIPKGKLHKEKYDEKHGINRKPNIQFPDVTKEDWFYNTVTELANKGIISGYAEDGTFRPKNKVTYAEFLTLLNNALGEKQANYTQDPTKWYQNTFNYLEQEGVINQAEITPGQAMTRYEMAKYLSLGVEKLYKLPRNIDNTVAKNILNKYMNIHKDYVEYINNVVNLALLQGDEHGNLRGDDNLTRAEVAQVIKNLERVSKPSNAPQPEGFGRHGDTYDGIKISGVDKYGKPYKLDERIMNMYPDYKKKMGRGIYSEEMLQEYGQLYIDKINEAHFDPNSSGYKRYERFAADIVDNALKGECDTIRDIEKSKAKGELRIGDIIEMDELGMT